MIFLHLVKEMLSPHQMQIDQKFANNKGELSWPVKGEIIERFGMYSIPQEVGGPIIGENIFLIIIQHIQIINSSNNHTSFWR